MTRGCTGASAAAHAEQVHPHIHPALEQRSLLAYLWRTFIAPGERLRYDGTPVVLPALRDDEDWVPSAASAADVDLGATAS